MKLSPVESLLHEHRASPHPWDETDLVQLAPDYPGFLDAAYRARRNAIARIAIEHREGPVPDVPYQEDEHATWRAVWESLGGLHARLGCREANAAIAQLSLPRTRIPQLAEVNATLARAAGFQLRPVAGLVGDRTFLAYLGRDQFLATQYMRHPSRPLYTPEPDVVHELVGHATTFCDPGFARLNRAFGRAAARVDEDTLARVGRVYWYTLEFGLCLEEGVPKAYGAGLLSSSGELAGFAERSELAPFDLERIAGTPYDPTDYQRTLFVLPRLGEGFEQVEAWLEALPTA